MSVKNEGEKFRVIGRSTAGTTWVAGPDADKQYTEAQATKMLLTLAKEAPEHAYSIEPVAQK